MPWRLVLAGIAAQRVAERRRTALESFILFLFLFGKFLVVFLLLSALRYDRGSMSFDNLVVGEILNYVFVEDDIPSEGRKREPFYILFFVSQVWKIQPISPPHMIDIHHAQFMVRPKQSNESGFLHHGTCR